MALDLRRRCVDGPRDRDVQSGAAPLEDARELADPTVRDSERRAVVTDRDHDECGGRIRADPFLRRLQRPQERECLEVDSDEGDARLLAGVDVTVDQLAVGDDEQDALGRLSVLVDTLAEHLVVEHGLVDRDRQRLLRAEPDRVGKLLLVFDPGDLEGADADPVVRDAESHAFLGQAVLGEEVLEGLGECVWVAKLAADDDARERAARARPAAARRSRCSTTRAAAS